jgi:hypothetical protein
VEVVTSTRHAIVAISSMVLGPPATVALAANQRWAGALILGALLVLYGIGEFLAWEWRDAHRAAKGRRMAHAAAGPLTGYTPQTDDRYWDQIESRRWTA